MYKFPSDLDLSHLIGCEVVQISLAPYNLFIQLEPENHINIEGVWRLYDSSGNLVDEGNGQDEKDAYRIHRLLTHKIEQYIVVNPTTLALIFENKWKLEIVDDSDQYESCSISPNIYI